MVKTAKNWSNFVTFCEKSPCFLIVVNLSGFSIQLTEAKIQIKHPHTCIFPGVHSSTGSLSTSLFLSRFRASEAALMISFNSRGLRSCLSMRFPLKIINNNNSANPMTSRYTDRGKIPYFMSPTCSFDSFNKHNNNNNNNNSENPLTSHRIDGGKNSNQTPTHLYLSWRPQLNGIVEHLILSLTFPGQCLDAVRIPTALCVIVVVDGNTISTRRSETRQNAGERRRRVGQCPRPLDIGLLHELGFIPRNNQGARTNCWEEKGKQRIQSVSGLLCTVRPRYHCLRFQIIHAIYSHSLAT